MRIKFIVLLLSAWGVFIVPAKAQFSIGLQALGNLSSVRMTYEIGGSGTSGQLPGLGIGLITQWRATKHYAFEPSLSYQFGGYTNKSEFANLPSFDFVNRYYYFQLALAQTVCIPLEGVTLKVSAVPYMNAGTHGYRKYDSVDGSFRRDYGFGQSTQGTERWEWGVGAGFGADVPMGNGFLTCEIRYNHGLRDVATNPNFAVWNRSLQVGVGYRFKTGK